MSNFFLKRALNKVIINSYAILFKTTFMTEKQHEIYKSVAMIC